MSLKMSRRGFVKASAVATASTLLLGASATTAAADEAAGASTSSDDVKIIPSACRQCYGRCALFGHVKDGRLVKIEGNPDLFSEGTLCGRCFAIPQELYNPLRVRYPQKRVGEKGSGQWKRITWEEAYQEARRPLHQDRRGARLAHHRAPVRHGPRHAAVPGHQQAVA